MSDGFDEMQAAVSAQRSPTGRKQDRLRQLKRDVRKKKAVALTYPAAGVVFYLLLAALWLYRDLSVLMYASSFVAALFVWLYLWARKQPIPALVTAAVVFAAFTGFAFYKFPGIALSVFGLLRYGGEGAWLVVSLLAAFKHRSLKRKLEAQVAAQK